MLGGIMLAIGNFRGLEVTEPHNITLTGSDNTTATVILANDILDDNKVNVTIVSPDVNDAPIAYDYTAATKRLTITGLQPDTSRQLSVVYLHPRLDDATDFLARFMPTFLLLAGLGLVIGAAVGAYRETRGG